MRIRQVIEVLNRMRDDGVIERYAIGGAVGATFYLEPVATLDVDVFTTMPAGPGSAIIDPQRIFRYLEEQGFPSEGEYVIIGGWPVQLLPPPSPVAEEALEMAVEHNLESIVAPVMTAEHLAAICLETGRAKDKARLLQFVEQGALDAGRFEEIIARHGLSAKWEKFREQFLEEA